jgi:hypothetical protein
MPLIPRSPISGNASCLQDREINEWPCSLVFFDKCTLPLAKKVKDYIFLLRIMVRLFVVGCCILFYFSWLQIGLNPQSTIFLEHQGILLIVGSIGR